MYNDPGATNPLQEPFQKVGFLSFIEALKCFRESDQIVIETKLNYPNLNNSNNLQHQNGGSSQTRYYVVAKTSSGSTGGRYASKSGPASAAKKAASKRFGRGNSVRLTVRETGTAKEFMYVAKRIKLANPVVRKIDGKTIVSEYRVEVKSA